MRRIIAEKNGMRTGDLVRIHVALRMSGNDARIGIWARSGTDDFSPYVPDEIALSLDGEGMPKFVTPMRVRLLDDRRKYTFSFTADRQLDFRVIQEVDEEAEISAKARIKRYGKAYQTFRRNIRDAVRAFRRAAAPLFRKQ